MKHNFLSVQLARPTISRQSDILLGVLGSTVEACFNVTGIPKPSLKISKGNNNNDIVSSINTENGCVYFGPLNRSDDTNGSLNRSDNRNVTLTVAAENCLGKSNFTLHLQIVQSKLRYSLNNIISQNVF